MLGVVFPFLVAFGEQPFAGLVSGSSNGGLATAALYDFDVEVGAGLDKLWKTMEQRGGSTYQLREKCGIDSRHHIKLFQSFINGMVKPAARARHPLLFSGFRDVSNKVAHFYGNTIENLAKIL